MRLSASYERRLPHERRRSCRHVKASIWFADSRLSSPDAGLHQCGSGCSAKAASCIAGVAASLAPIFLPNRMTVCNPEAEHRPQISPHRRKPHAISLWTAAEKSTGFRGSIRSFDSWSGVLRKFIKRFEWRSRSSSRFHKGYGC